MSKIPICASRRLAFRRKRAGVVTARFVLLLRNHRVEPHSVVVYDFVTRFVSVTRPFPNHANKTFLSSGILEKDVRFVNGTRRFHCRLYRCRFLYLTSAVVNAGDFPTSIARSSSVAAIFQMRLTFESPYVLSGRRAAGCSVYLYVKSFTWRFPR